MEAKVQYSVWSFEGGGIRMWFLFKNLKYFLQIFVIYVFHTSDEMIPNDNVSIWDAGFF